ncbi:uncharacterized protein KZ484_008146 [Pholidichthys leucotaenia]
MMKCLFVVVLLHLCFVVQANNLNNEIIKNLKNICRINITSSTHMPNRRIKNSSSCVDVIKKELQNLLKNATVHGEDRDHVDKLEGNLKELATQPLSATDEKAKCLMKQATSYWCENYINFFRRLNNTARR